MRSQPESKYRSQAAPSEGVLSSGFVGAIRQLSTSFSSQKLRRDDGRDLRLTGLPRRRSDASESPHGATMVGGDGRRPATHHGGFRPLHSSPSTNGGLSASHRYAGGQSQPVEQQRNDAESHHNTTIITRPSALSLAACASPSTPQLSALTPNTNGCTLASGGCISVPSPVDALASGRIGSARSLMGLGIPSTPLSARDAAMRQERDRHRVEIDGMWRRLQTSQQALQLSQAAHTSTQLQLLLSQCAHFVTLEEQRRGELLLAESDTRRELTAAALVAARIGWLLSYQCSQEASACPPATSVSLTVQIKDSDLLRALQSAQQALSTPCPSCGSEHRAASRHQATASSSGGGNGAVDWITEMLQRRLLSTACDHLLHAAMAQQQPPLTPLNAIQRSSDGFSMSSSAPSLRRVSVQRPQTQPGGKRRVPRSADFGV